MKRREPGKKVIGYGWSGLYDEEGPYRLGWLMSEFIDHKYRQPLSMRQREALGLVEGNDVAASDMYRVRITVELVKDSRGRYIRKRTKREMSDD